VGTLGYGQAVVLGLLQGLTEFLPVSSSGHLVLAQELLGLSFPGLRLEIVLHAGTALAVVVLLRRDILALVRSFLPGRGGGPDRALAWRLVVGTIPAAIAGLTLAGFVERKMTGPRTAAGFLLVTAAVLLAADRIRARGLRADELSIGSALLIGLAQAVAVIPGISRSGSTVSAGLAAGLDRGEAARFSLLLAVPVIAGGAVADLLGRDFGAPAAAGALPPGPLLAGLAAAFASGLAAALILLAAVRKAKLWWFAVYCACAGAAALLLL